ncbi:MAG: murein biosynthesis integral membrane protein MurJ [Phycisphaeraceae bacterium]|nr:murein biosynthesis integral membrane protein MurJ [Phycisphaeraceae bacterium]
MSLSPPAHETTEAELGQPADRRRMLAARCVLAVYWPLLFAGTHWPDLKLPKTPSHPLELVLQGDKVAHTVGFGGLTVLVLLSNLTPRRLAWSTRCAIAMLICMVYAIVDELTQSQVSGRSVTNSDMVANATAILGVYLIARQPRDSKPKRIPAWLLWPLVLTLPVAAAGFLSPWAMSQAVELKRHLWHTYDLQSGRMDYWAHGVFSFIAAAITFAIWPQRSSRPRRATLTAMLVLLLSGPAVEVAQYFTGRGVQALDVLAHTLGVLAAMVLWTLVPARKHQQAADLESTPAYKAAEDSSAFVGHAVLVSLLTLLSRFAGLARDAILAAALGLSVAADAFFIGFLVPNLFRRLFGEGALTAAFIPSYTDLLQRDPALAKRFASFTLTLLTVLLIGITLLGELVLWWMAQSLDPDSKASLAVYYTRIMLPYMPLICAVALIGGILQVHKRFGPPAATPLVLNGILVAAVLLTTDFFTVDIPASKAATAVAIGVLVAGVIQLIWQLTVLLSVTGLARSFANTWPAMRAMLIMMGPMVLGLAVFQINALLDALIAFFFAPGTGADAGEQLSMLGQTFDAPLRNGDVAALSWSQRLYQFPLGVFGIAIATAIFPALSAAASRFVGNNISTALGKPQAVSDEFAAIVRQGLRLTAFIAVPASAGLILVRVPLARTVFEHGSFTNDDALRVSVILAGYAASVWAYSMTHTLTRAFYALKDAKTPLKVSAAMVLLNLTLNLSLIWSLGAAGLAWSTAISAAGQVVLLILLLRKRVTKPIDESVIASWTRTVIATTVMAGLLFAVSQTVDPGVLTWAESAGMLLGMVLLGIAVFLLIARLTKAEELGWLRKRSVK